MNRILSGRLTVWLMNSQSPNAEKAISVEARQDVGIRFPAEEGGLDVLEFDAVTNNVGEGRAAIQKMLNQFPH